MVVGFISLTCIRVSSSRLPFTIAHAHTSSKPRSHAGVFRKGFTALHAAAAFASWPVVDALLTMGVNPKVTVAASGWDPLMSMCWSNRSNNVRRWCARFPTWNLSRRSTVRGETAMGIALGYGPDSTETVKALVMARVNHLEVTALTGATILHTAATNRDTDVELVRYLLGLPGVQAMIDTPMRGRTTLWKLKYLTARLFMKLRRKKTSTNTKTVSGWSMQTPLMSASRTGNAAVIKVLVLEGGADIHPRNSQGHRAFDVLVGGDFSLEESKTLLDPVKKLAAFGLGGKTSYSPSNND